MKSRMQQHRLSRFVMRKVVEIKRRKLTVAQLMGIPRGQGIPAGWTDEHSVVQNCGDPYCADCGPPGTRH